MKKICIILMIVLTIVFLPSCKKESDKEEKDKLPEHLKTIAEGNNKIIEDVEKIYDLMINPEKTDISQDELSGDKPESSDNNNDSNKESKDKDTKNEDSDTEEEDQNIVGDNQDSEAKTDIAQIISKMWQEVSNTCKEIHGNWNDYELDTIRDGADKEDIGKFEIAVNGLTIAVDNKDILDILYKTNDVNMSLAAFYDLYKGHIEGEKNRINYCIRGAYLSALENDWENSAKILRKTPVYIDELKDKLIIDDKNAKNLKKLEISIKDMQNAVISKNKELLLIKRDIVVDNLYGIVQGEKKKEK
ncbi:hypothetical protein PV797_17715 [Clostridiaceae bacterium M8S5]|nr:hypothetical protein PV797_17715 [Clostridiaceae bacterium M8S5]